MVGYASHEYRASHLGFCWGLHLHLIATPSGLPVAYALTGATAQVQGPWLYGTPKPTLDGGAAAPHTVDASEKRRREKRGKGKPVSMAADSEIIAWPTQTPVCLMAETNAANKTPRAPG
jgi:hypothetical protein